MFQTHEKDVIPEESIAGNAEEEAEETEEDEQEDDLKKMIEDSVEESVKRAFKKYGGHKSGVLDKVLRVVLIGAIALGGYQWWVSRQNPHVGSLEDHDVALEDNGIFGYKAADFADAILGESTREKLLVVEEREVSVNSVITDAGLFSWDVFSKQQMLTLHGVGQYTIDLTQIGPDDITLDEETFELTICIPHAQLHETIFNPSQTEVGDSQNGWLAFGSITMTAEQTKTFETEAVAKLEEKLSEEECFVEADRFAKLSAYETYQPVVSQVSPAYKVVIAFQE